MKDPSENKQLKEQKEVKEPRSKRPKFGSPYVPRGRLQSQVSEDKDSNKKRNVDKDDSSTSKKMRGRGSTSFHKAEDECLKEEDKEEEEEEEKPRVEKTIDEEDEMILKLPLKGDYKRYEAEVRRAIEEKQKKYYKTFVELKVLHCAIV